MNQALFTSHDSNFAWRDEDGGYHVVEFERLTQKRYYSLDDDANAMRTLRLLRQFKADFNDPVACLFPGASSRKWLHDRLITPCGHHDAHAACAFYQSPFEKSLILSFDGGGCDADGRVVFTTLYEASMEGGIKRIELFDNLNLGTRYRDAAMHMPEIATPGSNRDTWPGKAMALAAYGAPGYADEAHAWLKGEMQQLDPSFDHPDWLASVQQAFEEICLALVTPYLFTHGPNLCVTGGCALNVRANQRLSDAGWNVFVPSNPSDCGIALGMLLWEHRQKIDATYAGHDGLQTAKIADTDLKRAAKALRDGDIVALVTGRPEHGPRALGHRSIIAPDIPGMRRHLNKIKSRASFRPVAPVVRDAHVNQFFVSPGSPNMSLAPQALYKGESVHVDGSARVQVVSEGHVLHRLLEFYEALHPDLPILLNTSLNVKGRPLAGSVRDVQACLQSGINHAFGLCSLNT